MNIKQKCTKHYGRVKTQFCIYVLDEFCIGGNFFHFLEVGREWNFILLWGKLFTIVLYTVNESFLYGGSKRKKMFYGEGNAKDVYGDIKHAKMRMGFIEDIFFSSYLV